MLRERLYPEPTGGHEYRKPEVIVEAPLEINPDTIWDDNHSHLGKDLRKEFAENKRRKKWVFKKGCIEARRWRLRATRTLHYDTIAAAGDPHDVSKPLEDENVAFGAIELHHGTEIKRVPPTECGGRDAKGRQMEDPDKTDPYGNGIAAFVTNEILHHDVLIQGCRTAARIAKITEKPIAVVTENHRTGRLKLVAVYHQRGNVHYQQSAIVDQDLLYGEYKPEELYINGIPEIPLAQIENTDIREYLEESNRELEELRMLDPDYEKKHTLHNPDLMKLTTDISSAGIILPETSAHPGAIVRLTVPRRGKVDDGQGHSSSLQLSDINKSWQQAEYVVSHAVEGHGELKKPFSKTRTIFIALRRYEKAEELARDFMSRTFANDWLTLPDRRIIIAQTRHGEINKIGEILYDMKQGRPVNIQTKTRGEIYF